MAQQDGLDEVDDGGLLVVVELVELLSDRHGDVVGGFDPADTALAALSDSRSFDPWGKPIAQQGAVSVLGYQGSWTDPVSGQVNMKSRWYDTETGTFASHDSVDYQSGPSVLANPYLYAAANPMTLNDLDGRWPSCGVCHTVAGAVSSAVRHTVSTAAHYAGVAYHAVASAAEKVYSYGKGVVTAVVNAAAYVVGKAKQGLTRIAGAVSAGIHIAADGIAWAKQRAAEIAAAAHRAAVASMPRPDRIHALRSGSQLRISDVRGVPDSHDLPDTGQSR